MARPHTLTWGGTAFRLKALAEAADILAPAHATEGRFHRDGQRALYLSLTPEGCIVATKRYLTEETPKQGIFPLKVSDARLVDLRDATATTALGIDTAHRAIEWQNLRAKGLPSPTWDLADRVREMGLDGMLYASRTDPAKTHLTLFRWNESGTAATVRQAGEVIPV